MSKRRGKGGTGIPQATNAVLSVRHRALKETEEAAHAVRNKMLEHANDDEEEEEDKEEEEDEVGSSLVSFSIFFVNFAYFVQFVYDKEICVGWNQRFRL